MAATLLDIIKFKIKPLDIPDEDIQMYIDEVEVAIKNFINYREDDELPDRIKYIEANMVADLIKDANPDDSGGGEIDVGGGVTSIKVGDTTLGFGDNSTEKIKSADATAKVVNDYAEQLYHFRRLNWGQL